MGDDKTYNAHLTKNDETNVLAKDETGIVLHDVNECGWTLHYRRSDGLFRKISLTAGSLISMSPFSLAVQADLARAFDMPKIATLFSENFVNPVAEPKSKDGAAGDRLITRTTETPRFHYVPGLSNVRMLALNDRIEEARRVYQDGFWHTPTDGTLTERAVLEFGAGCISSANARHYKEVERLTKERDTLREALAQARREWTPTQGPTEAWLAVVAILLPKGTLGTCTGCGAEELASNISISGLCARCWLGPVAPGEKADS